MSAASVETGGQARGSTAEGAPVAQPLTFDSDEKKLLITMLSREGTSHMNYGMHQQQLEFVARCFDLAAKVARAPHPISTPQP